CGFVEEQVILASLFTPPDVCANDTVFMGYEIETVVPEPDNSFIVELSDTEGNFSEEPDVLMVLEQTDIEGVIIIPLPENLEEGFYSVRLRMTHPAYVGSPLAVPLVGPVPALTTTALEGCPGDLVLLEAREGSRYRWFPEELFPNQNRDNQQLQITGAGAVWVEAEWFGCGSYVDTFYIEPIEVVIPELSFDGTNVFFEYGDFEEVEWYFDDDLVAITEESFFLFQGNGLYRVRVLDVNGCWVWSEGLTITSSTSLAQNAIKVYPNPVVDQLVLEINEAGYQRYRIWQTDGRLMTQQALPKGQQQISIDWSRFVHGMYILEVIGEQRIEVFRIIKQ
ncbi:MAG: T9SS type A sorting domain-containing protein, partial [Bacteroidota bacterium]